MYLEDGICYCLLYSAWMSTSVIRGKFQNNHKHYGGIALVNYRLLRSVELDAQGAARSALHWPLKSLKQGSFYLNFDQYYLGTSDRREGDNFSHCSCIWSLK